MKKIILILLLTTSLMAKVKEGKMELDIHAVYATANTELDGVDEDKAEYGLGFGLNYVTESNLAGAHLLVAASFDYLINDSDIYTNRSDDDTLDIKIKLGVSAFKRVNTYYIFAARVSGFDNGLYGTGHGVGLEFRLTNSIGLEGTYVIYDLSPSGTRNIGVNDIDHEVVSITLKYYF